MALAGPHQPTLRVVPRQQLWGGHRAAGQPARSQPIPERRGTDPPQGLRRVHPRRGRIRAMSEKEGHILYRPPGPHRRHQRGRGHQAGAPGNSSPSACHERERAGVLAAPIRQRPRCQAHQHADRASQLLLQRSLPAGQLPQAHIRWDWTRTRGRWVDWVGLRVTLMVKTEKHTNKNIGF